MTLRAWVFFGGLVLAAAWGCSQTQNPAGSGGSGQPSTTAATDSGTYDGTLPAQASRHAPAAGGGAEARIEAELAKLSAADQAAARAQKICPVSGEPLGSMAGLTKVSLEGGREVFVCCGGCIETLKAEPAQYLAKLDSPAPTSGADLQSVSPASGNAETPAAN